MFNKILCLVRKNDDYSKKLVRYLKKRSKKLVIFNSSKVNEKIKSKIFQVPNNHYDYIFSFRSYFILKKQHLKKAKISSINFHPGPPNYRGFGGINFALYNGEKKWGITIHLMSEKLDGGKIVDYKSFNIGKYDNLDTLLKKTHTVLLFQSKKVIQLLNKDKKNLSKLIKKNKKFKWSKKIYSKKELELFYEINLNDSKEKIYQKINATVTPKFKPFIKYKKKKFYLG
jgi:methionyl-tRNA formyltransferase